MADSFSDTFAAIKNGEAEYAVVAIENSLYGSINNVYDLLLENKYPIVGEIYLHINFVLAGVESATLEDISEVYSHYAALGECANYLTSKLPNAKRLENDDTAKSAEDVAGWNDKSKAVICSREAAEKNNLYIIEDRIQDHEENYTRFVIVQNNGKPTKDANKTSLVLTTKADTKSGSLHSALGAFAKNGINLSMLQSRPLVGKAWHYLFYIDFDKSEDDPSFVAAKSELDQLGWHVEVLGSYKSAQDSVAT